MDQVLIVEDVAETRRWLAEIVTTAFPFCQIHEAAGVAAAKQAAAARFFSLALIDLGLPDGAGIDVLRHLRLTSPSTLCVITTVVGEDSHIVSALSPSIARRIMEHFRMTGPATGDGETNLSDREKQILGLIARGLRNSETGETLGIAESTVASHIKSIYRKLGISTRAEASWHAMRMGL